VLLREACKVVYRITLGSINLHMAILTRFFSFLDTSPAPEWAKNAGKQPREQP
jgi:hypothetical protein